MRTFSYVRSLPVTWQIWLSHHWICHTQNHMMIHSKLMAFSSMDPVLWAIEVYIALTGIFDFFAPMTLTLTRWPAYANLTCSLWIYTGSATSDRQTNRHDQIYRPRRFAGGQKRKYNRKNTTRIDMFIHSVLLNSACSLRLHAFPDLVPALGTFLLYSWTYFFFCNPESYRRDGRSASIKVYQWLDSMYVTNKCHPSPHFFQGIKKCEILPRFSTPVASEATRIWNGT